RGLTSLASTGISTCVPARTDTASGIAIGATDVDAATKNTEISPRTARPEPSITVTLAVPMSPGAPSRVEPLTRMRDCATTSTDSDGVELIASVTTRTRPVVFCTAPKTSTVVSSFARTNAVSGAIVTGRDAHRRQPDDRRLLRERHRILNRVRHH